MATTPLTVVGLLERLSRLMAHDGHALGLRPAQWDALRYLARANRFSRTPSALTVYLGSTKGTVSQTLGALERKGWVRKVRAEADKRSVTVALTDSGHAMLADDPVAATLNAVAQLAPTQREALVPGLRAILEHRLAENGGRPFGICRACRFFERDHPDGAPHHCGLLQVPLDLTDVQQICIEQEPADGRANSQSVS